MQNGIVRLQIYSVEDVFSYRKHGIHQVITDSGYEFDLNTPQIRCFEKFGTACAEKNCPIVGTYFAAEKHKSAKNKRAHLRLYGLDPKGNEVEVTLDHILARALGGHSTDRDNHQPLCQVHNNLKSRWEQLIIQKYGKAYNLIPSAIEVLEARYGRTLNKATINFNR